MKEGGHEKVVGAIAEIEVDDKVDDFIRKRYSGVAGVGHRSGMM